jgi:putative nucleotidyltransferase with HDIG domain
VLSANPEAEGYFDRLLHLAASDRLVAAHVIRCANSPFNPPAAPIVSLRQAVARLGGQQCAELVLALAIAKVFPPRSAVQRFLWIHSLQTALFARMFAQHLLADRCHSDQAFLCGLLHDIGRLVQSEVAPADLTPIDDMRGLSPQEQVDVERTTLGFDHALLGWHVCNEWSLPSAIGEVVRDHHDPRLADSPRSPDLVRIVQWADVLSVTVFARPDLVFSPPATLARHMATEYPGIATGLPEVSEHSWHGCVLSVYARSMQLAHEVICFSPVEAVAGAP